jgi:hypothetical protein
MNTIEELDTAADAFRKRYLAGQRGSTTSATRGAPPPSGSPTPSDTEFALLDAAYGGTGTDSGRSGSQQVAAMNRALDTVQEADARGEQRGLCGMGGKKKSSASWFAQFRCASWAG